MFAGCCQLIWAVGKTMWVRGSRYCQLIRAENQDICRLDARCSQVATPKGCSSGLARSSERVAPSVFIVDTAWDLAFLLRHTHQFELKSAPVSEDGRAPCSGDTIAGPFMLALVLRTFRPIVVRR